MGRFPRLPRSSRPPCCPARTPRCSSGLPPRSAPVSAWRSPRVCLTPASRRVAAELQVPRRLGGLEPLGEPVHPERPRGLRAALEIGLAIRRPLELDGLQRRDLLVGPQLGRELR